MGDHNELPGDSTVLGIAQASVRGSPLDGKATGKLVVLLRYLMRYGEKLYSNCLEPLP